MLKRNKWYVVITTIIILLPMIVGLVLWDRLPDTIATHFNFAGEADGWSGKTFAVIGLPLFLTGIHVICIVAMLADPRKKNIQDKIFRMVLWIVPSVSMFTMGGLYLYTLEVPVDMARLEGVVVGILFVVIGNYLPKCRQNYTVGIKVPWALADQENWNRTHRFAGWLWTGGGVVFALTALLGIVHEMLLFVIVMIMALVPMLYSYVFYLRHGKSE